MTFPALRYEDSKCHLVKLAAAAVLDRISENVALMCGVEERHARSEFQVIGRTEEIVQRSRRALKHSGGRLNQTGPERRMPEIGHSFMD